MTPAVVARAFDPFFTTKPVGKGTGLADAAASSLLLGKPEDALLIVDDDESARRMTALAARELGYTALEAEDGPSALSTLRAHPEIGLLITDVVMPGMDGAKLSREAVFRRHNLRVLYVTGYHAAKNGLTTRFPHWRWNGQAGRRFGWGAGC
jgi:CheY-like chemotaxis protein